MKIITNLFNALDNTAKALDNTARVVERSTAVATDLVDGWADLQSVHQAAAFEEAMAKLPADLRKKLKSKDSSN